MIDDRQLGRALRSWLDEEPAALPTHVFDAILGEVPGVRQRRARPWDRVIAPRTSRLLLVGAVLLLAVGSLVVAGAAGWLRLSPPPRPFPAGEVPLDPGRYVVDGFFPSRISLEVPDGWAAIERGTTWVSLRRDVADGPTIIATVVQATNLDPCHPDDGLWEELGPTDADLAAALAALPGLRGTRPTVASVGGRSGWVVRLQAPATDPGCTGSPDEGTFVLWGLPHGLSIDPGERAEFRTTMVDGSRIVIAAVIPPRATVRDQAEVDAVVSTFRFGNDADVVPEGEATEDPGPDAAVEDPLLLPIPSSGPLQPVATYRRVPIYGRDAAGRPRTLPSLAAFVLQPPRGWFGSPAGIASSPDPEIAGAVEIWSIAEMHPDPCRWRTSSTPVDATDLDALAEALDGDWAPADATARPRAGPISDPAWLGHRTLTIALTMRADLDVSTCDGGEARLWSEPGGLGRVAWPGMTVEIRLVPVGGGIIAGVRITPAGASDELRRDLDAVWSSMSILEAPATYP